MAGSEGGKVRRNIVCPFCGLACDDLSLAIGRNRLEVREAGCAVSRQGFERRLPAADPRVNGRAVQLDSAIAECAAILRASLAPLFAGLATDVAGARATMRLAERTGGIVDHLGAEGLFRNLRVVQDSGWMATTLSEVRNHADFLLVVGPDPMPLFPRFLERCIGRRETLYAEAAAVPQVVRLGPEGDLDCPIERLPEAVSALRCWASGRTLLDMNIAGIPSDRLQTVARQLASARYGVVVWAAGAFEFAGGGLLVQLLSDLVRDVNLVTRCAALPLGGSDNAIGVNQVCTWQSGVPLRSSFARGSPQHDALLYRTDRLLAEGEVDALLWISSFRPLPPPAATLPTIILAPPDIQLPNPPAVFIPVATPGVDHDGDVFRTDGVVALHLTSLRPAVHPSVAAVLSGIADALDAEPVA